MYGTTVSSPPPAPASGRHRLSEAIHAHATTTTPATQRSRHAARTRLADALIGALKSQDPRRGGRHRAYGRGTLRGA